MNTVRLADAHPERRYELVNEGRLIGFIEYYLFGAVAIVTHTEVDPAIEGSGHGSELARRALDYLHGQDKQVVPVCGFFASFIRKNPEYIGHVTPESRRIFKL